MKKLNILFALILCTSIYAKDKSPDPQQKITVAQKAQYDQRATSMHDMLYGKVEEPKKVVKKEPAPKVVKAPEPKKVVKPPEPKKVEEPKKPVKRDEPWVSLQHQRNMRALQLK